MVRNGAAAGGRGRAQNLLLYLTAGVAFADIAHRYAVTRVDVNETFPADNLRWGGVAGAGVEWAWTSRTSFKLEGLYHRFGETTSNAFSPDSGRVYSFDNLDSIWTVRVGVNFKLGSD